VLIAMAGLVAVPGVANADTLLCKSSDYSCLAGTGYVGQSVWGSWGPGHNCVSYAAYRLRANGASQQWSPIGNGSDWDENARRVGVRVDTSPAVGSIAQWDGNNGHVAYVEAVTSTYIEISEDSYVTPTSGYSSRRRLDRGGSQFAAAEFIHVRDVGPNLAGYANTIVQWDGDTKAQKTSWLVTPDLRRLWIPDTGTYYCLKARGYPGPTVLSASVLDQLTDQTNMWAACGDTLAVNRVLRRNMWLKSSDGRYTLWLQGDGNFVLYGPTGHALWANNRFTTDFIIMQGDGNLVGYTNSGAPTWASNTSGSGGNRLVVQSDGNLVIYSATRAVWASNTAGRV
jgi:surface antigen